MNVLTNPRSILHAVQPLGQGTADVESLLSYFCRLAVSHSTSTLSLSRAVATMAQHEIPQDFDWHARKISGLGETALTWSAALSALTTVGRLDALTFLPWQNVVAQNGLSMVSRGQFCPACLAEDKAAGKVPYLRLAWEAEAVSVCPRHMTALHRHCACCGRDNIRHAAAFVVPGWCTHCGAFLGQATGGDGSVPSIAPSALWQARQVAALLVAQQQLLAVPSREKLLDAVTHIITTMDGGQPAVFARRVGVGKSTVHHWLKGPGTPKLDISLQIALHCGISLPKLLTGEVEGWEPPMPAQQMELKLLFHPREARAAPRELDWENIETQLEIFLRQPTPISVVEAARRVSVEPRQLYLRANRTTRMVGERWVAYMHRCQEAKVVRAWPYLEAACTDLLAEGKAVTKREITKRVPAEILSPVPHLLNVLKDVQAHLATLSGQPA